MNQHKYPYIWSLLDLPHGEPKGKVFSCFAGSGGSSIGYKLAGFDVIGCNEIDPELDEVYVKNLHPKHNYLMLIQRFKKLKKYPKELYDLDILDGSFPCSPFSIVGKRDRDWGINKVFREGQVKQILDTLAFDFVDVAERLQPKAVIMENVKGLKLGKAKPYFKAILEKIDKIGYHCQYRLLNAKDMGVPQNRERIIFCCLRKDIYIKMGMPTLNLEFNEEEILASEIEDEGNVKEIHGRKLRTLWENRIEGERNVGAAYQRLFGKNSYFTSIYIYRNEVCGCLTTRKEGKIWFHKPFAMNELEAIRISSFPTDYDFKDADKFFCLGMCVPPVMMAHIADRVFDGWLCQLPKENEKPQYNIVENDKSVIKKKVGRKKIVSDSKIKKLCEQGYTDKEIAVLCKMTVEGVRTRRRMLKISKTKVDRN